jgi:hypothetical protein
MAQAIGNGSLTTLRKCSNYLSRICVRRNRSDPGIREVAMMSEPKWMSGKNGNAMRKSNGAEGRIL